MGEGNGRERGRDGWKMGRSGERKEKGKEERGGDNPWLLLILPVRVIIFTLSPLTCWYSFRRDLKTLLLSFY